MSNVHCSINNCHYWKNPNLCTAVEILVTSDTMAQNLSDMIDAPYAAGVTQTPVANSVETCCKSFVSRTDQKQNFDGIRQNT